MLCIMIVNIMIVYYSVYNIMIVNIMIVYYSVYNIMNVSYSRFP